MLGGFSAVADPAADEGVQAARAAVEAELSKRLGAPVAARVLSARAQVVAGMNYELALVVAAGAGAAGGGGRRRFAAKVHAPLPHAGGGHTVTALTEEEAGGGGGAAAEDPQSCEADDAAAWAVQALSAQSNSLFPLQLKRVEAAAVERAGGAAVHRLRLRCARGAEPDETFDVEVVESPRGYTLRSSDEARGGG